MQVLVYLYQITTKITNKTTARVTGSTITAQNILIQAAASINKDTTATASSGAFGGSANDVSDDTTVNNQTYAEVGSGSKLTAIDADQDGDAIVIIAASNNSYKGYATAIAGAIIAKGVAKAVQNVTDDVRVKIYPSAILANKGNIKIYASYRIQRLQIQACQMRSRVRTECFFFRGRMTVRKMSGLFTGTEPGKFFITENH